MSDEEFKEELENEGDEGGNQSESDFEQHDESDSSYSSDEEADLVRRNLLFLCQEGQLRIAHQRFKSLVQENHIDQLKREIFQIGPDKNTPLHEILMGGTSDRNAKALTEKILNISQQWSIPHCKMLITQPPSHLRTALHWATWGNADLSILRTLVYGNPEALTRRDKKNKGNRTPVEIYDHYFINRDRTSSTISPETMEKHEFLERLTLQWTRHRVRNSIYGCAIYYFRTQDLTPFNKKDRKNVKVKPKPWFVLSVLGYLLQREIQPLVFHILSYIGKDARVHDGGTKKRKRKSS